MHFSQRAAALAAAFGAVIASIGSATAQSWQIQTLDSLGYSGAIASGINDSGQVVGFATDANGDSHPILWTGGTVQELGYISASQKGEAYKINNQGQIVGWTATETGAWRATLWNGVAATNLGTLGGSSSFAMNINDNGMVVGSSAFAAAGSHAFTWTQGDGMVSYGSFDPNSTQYYAGFNGVNNSGFLVGTGYRIFTPYHAVWATPGQGSLTDIALPGQFSTSMANAVNDAGIVVGFSNNGSGSEHAVIFTAPGQITDLDTLGYGASRAFDLNESGWIVGDAYGEVGGNWVQRAFLYRDGQMLDLTDVLPANSGWTELSIANGINEQGQIVGSGIYNGVQTAFIMTPVPEPATLAVLGLGALAVLRRRTRR